MKKIIDFLIDVEALRLKAYLCSAGRWTIGVGSTFYADGRPVKQGDKITKEEALKLAEFTALRMCQTVKRVLKRPVNENQFVALASFCYNVGEPRFARSLLVQAINDGADDETIKALFLRSFITENGVESDGLKNRRQKELTLYFKA